MPRHGLLCKSYPTKRSHREYDENELNQCANHREGKHDSRARARHFDLHSYARVEIDAVSLANALAKLQASQIRAQA